MLKYKMAIILREAGHTVQIREYTRKDGNKNYYVEEIDGVKYRIIDQPKVKRLMEKMLDEVSGGLDSEKNKK